jgi:hypothetical protein
MSYILRQPQPNFDTSKFEINLLSKEEHHPVGYVEG